MRFQDFFSEQVFEDELGPEHQRLWCKSVVGSVEYYHTSGNGADIFSIASTPEDVLLEKVKANPHGVFEVANRYLVAPNNKIPQDRLVELPHGSYEFRQDSPSLPNRLVPLKLRKDKYAIAAQSCIQAINTHIATFLSSKEQYVKMGSLYKTGILLYGLPGNGKTALIRHLALTTLPSESYVIWIDKSIPDSGFLTSLRKLPGLKIFIIEEITSHNESSGNIKELLTFLDGEKSLSDTIVIATTNYPEELQTNLTDRPGRFDLVVEVESPSQDEAETLVKYFLQRDLTDSEKAVKLTDLSVAHLQHAALQMTIHKKPLLEVVDNLRTGGKRVKNRFKKHTKIGM